MNPALLLTFLLTNINFKYITIKKLNIIFSLLIISSLWSSFGHSYEINPHFAFAYVRSYSFCMSPLSATLSWMFWTYYPGVYRFFFRQRMLFIFYLLWAHFVCALFPVTYLWFSKLKWKAARSIFWFLFFMFAIPPVNLFFPL